ncbi:MAG: PilT/PilU family type 4a pilus ATPase [Magnetococcales bacterium]|nr:PilT/PilU family type 4a pilus ATPase [Magnetococcales bacterium]MBF0157116.1 PilT/PilU family type 4a pilus ATPase [Magnetococcales bacterium]
MNITPYLKLMIEKGGSDLYFSPRSPPRMKLDGRMAAIGKDLLTAEAVKAAVFGILDEDQARFFEENLEIDFAISLGEEGRFRVNAFHQRNEAAMVLRYIKADVPNLDKLRVPEILKDLIMHKRGLLLMVGGTGSGKSTTLAAMIDHRNANQSGHILTIEDPIEFLHPHKKSLVNQREVGPDTHSYHNALKSALREAPDVILIGEIRDRETMEAALELAGTGHLAISTLHANNAYQAMNRIINMFPQNLHKQLFMDLSLYLRAILSQRLVVSVDGKRRAAVEVMVNTPHIAELVLAGQVDEIKTALEESSEKGMQSFDTALLQLFKEGAISQEEALNSADSRANLEARIHFG